MAEIMVGGAFLSAFLNVLFKSLDSRQVVDFLRKKKLDANLFMKLKISLMTVSVVLDDAETKEDTHPAVKQWLEELKDVIYHAEDVLDEIVTLASKPKPKKTIFSHSIFFSNKKFDVKRVEDIVNKMEFLASQKELLGLHERVGDHNFIRGGRTTTSLVDAFVYGRDDEQQKMVESLLMDVAVGDPIPVITIVGMGGIGKTTLAKMVYNDEKLDEYFDTKVWVCVTQELDVFHITKIVLETIASSPSSESTDLNLLQLKLKEALKGKKILLVLDDVWNEDYSKWRMLCDPFTTVSSGSKIIVTTRNESVASIMRTSHSHPVEQLSKLSDENGWKLFAHHAFESRNRDDYPLLEVTGIQIVKKCKGLPLALKALGGLLRSKDDVKAWEDVMKSEIWGLRVGNSSIIPALRLSYHYLPTHLKRCFAYCSIFPQDFEFRKEKLVLLWMAEGFVIDNTDKSMEEVGEEYFDELFSRSFFQKSSSRRETFFVMHDLNHDLATYVSGKFCLNLERSKTLKLSEKVRHFSYSEGKFDDYHKFGLILNAKHLRTFLPMRLYNYDLSLSIAIIRDLLLELSCIRVLSLSSYRNVNELPDSICTLMHLRYLDLSHTSIPSLPDGICQLYNLQTLLLSNCRRLIKLPTNLGELVNLRHLDITETSIKKLPPRIKRLESLQTLSTFIVGKDNCSGLEELNGLRHLKCSLSIRGLRNVKNVEDVIEANLKEKMGIKQLSFAWGEGTNNHNIILDKLQPSAKLNRLTLVDYGGTHFSWGEGTNKHNITLDKLQPSAKLNRLTLVDYGGTHFSNWLGDGSLFNLTYLKISNCIHCLSLSSLGQLPSLVELSLIGITRVRRVSSEFYGNRPSSVKPFQKLVILKFERMSEWEEWSPSGGGDNDDFPKLETLSIRNCPSLSGNLPKFLPLLRDLCIEECGELSAIIPLDLSPRSLKLEGCKNIVFKDMSRLNSLISLKIGDIESNSFPIGMLENCINLEELRISDWSSFTQFPDDGLPTTLKQLHISSYNNLKFLSKETFQNYKCLEKLILQDSSCDSMTSFPLGLFPNLKFLEIFSLKNLESFSIDDEDHENLRSLQTLFISGCDKLINFPSGGLRTPNLTTISIQQCKSLKSLPELMNTQLTSLQRLSINDCEEVKLFPAGCLPSNLQSLHISNCKKVMAEGREWDLHTLPSLTSLFIRECEEIETFSEAEWQLPTSITWLVIWNFPNLKTIDASRLPNLQSLWIRDCPKVEFNSKLRNTQDLPASFISLSINNCQLMAKQLLQSRNRDLIPVLMIDDVRYFTDRVFNNKDPVAK